MADSKISALPAATTALAGTEVLPIVQSSTTKQVSVANLTAGRAISATQLTLTTGNVIVASGQGIDFSATAGTGTSELLADYEEGTWTPSLGGNTTYNGQSGNYIKIGKMVYVEGNVNVNLIGTGSTYLVSGLPFTSATQTTGARATLSVNYFNSTANIVTFVALYLNSAATSAAFQGIAAAGTTMSTIGIFGNSTDVYFSGCYSAAS